MKKYYMPTQVLMGENCVAENREIFAQMGKRALLVTGRQSAKICGVLEDVTEVLRANGQEYELFDQVMNNPTVECVYDGGALARKTQVDFVIAMGGGSPMDAAKVIAMLAQNEIPKEEIFSGLAGYSALPMIHIPTTAGTGSEVTPYAILTNEQQETKTSVTAASMFPRYALLDEKYLQKLPKSSMIHTVADSLSHSIEGMFSVRASEISDGMALQAVSMIAKCMPALKNNELSQEERRQLLTASAMGGMVISATGTTIVHSMGYSLTYFHGTDHGRANGLLLPDFLREAARSYPDRVERILHAMGLSSPDQFAEQLEDLLGTRETLTAEEIEKYTRMATGSKNIKNCIVPITGVQIREIFTNSLGAKD